MVSFWMIWGTPILGNIWEEEFAYHSRVLGLFPPDFSEAVFSWIQENRNQICDDLRTSLRFIGLSHGIIDPPKKSRGILPKKHPGLPIEIAISEMGRKSPISWICGRLCLIFSMEKSTV
jgi:hypothetical protein